MEPGGSYGQNAASQLAFLNLLKHGILADVHKGAVIYDLGCADGINSLGLLRDMRNITADFTVGMVDLPENDWSTTRRVVGSVVGSVFPRQGGTVRSADIGAIRRAGPGPRAVMVGRSFYSQVAPAASVDVAFSSTAVQYLSASGDADRAGRARADWLSFLLNRQTELAPGGSLHVTGLSTYFEGQSPGHIWTVVQSVLGEAVQGGLLTKEKRDAWHWPAYPRTEDEWLLPFTLNQVPGLSLEQFKVVVIDSPYWSKSGGDGARFAELYVPSVMAWIGDYVGKSLGPPVRSLLQRHLTQVCQRRPELFKQDFMQAVLSIRRNGRDLRGAPAHGEVSLPEDFKPQRPVGSAPLEVRRGTDLLSPGPAGRAGGGGGGP